MNVTYTWVVTGFERLKSHNTHENVITRVLGNLVANDSDSGSKAMFPFAVTLDVDTLDSESFIDFNSIDEETVLGWINTAWGPERVAAEKQALVEEIEYQLNFETVAPPWSSV